MKLVLTGLWTKDRVYPVLERESVFRSKARHLVWPGDWDPVQRQMLDSSRRDLDTEAAAAIFNREFSPVHGLGCKTSRTQ